MHKMPRDQKNEFGSNLCGLNYQTTRTRTHGPLTTASSFRSRYMLIITTDFSRYTWFFFLKKKSDTLSKFQQFKTMTKLQGNFKFKTMRLDKRGEYTSNASISFCETSRIVKQLTQTHPSSKRCCLAKEPEFNGKGSLHGIQKQSSYFTLDRGRPDSKLFRQSNCYTRQQRRFSFQPLHRTQVFV